jgi:hypothetical protein
MLGVQMDDLPVLRQVRLLGDMVYDVDRTFVEKACGTIQVLLCASSGMCGMATERWAAFTNLRWLVIMIQEYFDDVPKGLPALEGVEVVQRGVEDLAKVDMELITQCILTGLLRAGHQSLQKVTLQLTPVYGNQQDWISQYEWLFKEEGVLFVLETATPSEIRPQWVPSTHLQGLRPSRHTGNRLRPSQDPPLPLFLSDPFLPSC